MMKVASQVMNLAVKKVINNISSNNCLLKLEFSDLEKTSKYESSALPKKSGSAR